MTKNDASAGPGVQAGDSEPAEGRMRITLKCGTAGCAIGTAALLPEFQAAGLTPATLGVYVHAGRVADVLDAILARFPERAAADEAVEELKRLAESAAPAPMIRVEKASR